MLDRRVQRRVGIVGRALIPQGDVRLGGETLAEGAGALVLENLGAAKARGARILGGLAGCARAGCAGPIGADAMNAAIAAWSKDRLFIVVSSLVLFERAE